MGLPDSERSRATTLRGIEDRAEQLNAHQLDLIAQLEAHLRAVHHTMRGISSLRTARYRIGDELTNGQRVAAIDDLESQVSAIEIQLAIQLQTCHDMQELLGRMHESAAELRQATQQLDNGVDHTGADA